MSDFPVMRLRFLFAWMNKECSIYRADRYCSWVLHQMNWHSDTEGRDHPRPDHASKDHYLIKNICESCLHAFKTFLISMVWLKHDTFIIVIIID